MPEPILLSAKESIHETRVAAEPALDLSWQARRDWFHARTAQEQVLAEVGMEELAAHFSGMPAYYWERVNRDDLLWGLETIHGFFKLIAAPSSPGQIFLGWREASSGEHTRIMLCTWDRHGLLAKAAAALSAVGLNILEADVFTRADNLVLDVFCVTDSEGGRAASPARLNEMAFLLEGALAQPPRFASVWACVRHKYIASPGIVPPRVTFDNESSPVCTVLRLEASDRLGLLQDLLQALADNGMDIRQARIRTDADMAHDVLHVTDAVGQKVIDLGQLEDLRRSLEAALNLFPSVGGT